MRMRTVLPVTVLTLIALAPRAGAQLPLPPSLPGAAIQFMPCFETDDDRAEAIEKIRRALRHPVTKERPDVRSVCSAANWFLGTETLGVWLTPLPSNLPWNRALRILIDDARRRGLQEVDVTDDGELFGWAVSSAFINTLRDRAWEAMPKQLNGEGQPSEDGPVHVEGLSVTLIEPAQVRTVITGFYDAGPNVDFTMRVLDTITNVDGKLRVETDTDLDIDPSLFQWLVGVIAVISPPLGIYVADLINGYLSKPGQMELPQTFGAMLAQFAPDQVMLRGGTKADFRHTWFTVSVKHGVSGGGDMDHMSREPEVDIEGPLEPVSFERMITLTYRAVPFDLRPTDDEGSLEYEWFLDGDLVAAASSEADIPFRIPVNVRPGEINEYELRVQVTDADGLTAERAVTVRLRYEREQKPPICYRKPWLPQCRPGPVPDR